MVKLNKKWVRCLDGLNLNCEGSLSVQKKQNYSKYLSNMCRKKNAKLNEQEYSRFLS